MASLPVSGHIDLPSSNTVWQKILFLRLFVGSGVVLGAAISLIGTSWDIQWHSLIGRDRTLIPPHIMMLSGIAIVGLLALTSVILETIWVKRAPHLASSVSSFAGLFSGSLGMFVAGFAALSAAIAFPLDSYWHALFGIDVQIWAPFHVMIIFGMAIAPLGGAYTLLSSSQIGIKVASRKAVRLSYFLTTIALGTMLGVFTLLLSDALYDRNYISIASNIQISLFPILSCFFTAYAFAIAKFAIPTRFSAISVLLCYLGFAIIFSLFVPTATDTLVALEGLQYRNSRGITFLSLVAMVAWPLHPILVAPLSDFFFGRAKRAQWSRNTLFIVLTLTSLIAAIPIFALRPEESIKIAQFFGPISVSISLLLGLLGAYLGVRTAQFTAEAISQEGVEKA